MGHEGLAKTETSSTRKRVLCLHESCFTVSAQRPHGNAVLGAIKKIYVKKALKTPIVF